MTEEVKDTKETVDESKKEEMLVEEPQYSDVEIQAMEQGWLPKDQWEESGKDPSEWRSAKEFKERGEFFSTIHGLKRENRNLSQGLDALKKHHQFIFDQAYRKAQADLKKERREAIRNEDFDRLDQIESEMDTLQTEYQNQNQELTKVELQPQEAPELAAFVARNSWYQLDSELRDEADAIGMIYAKRNPGSTPATVLDHVEKTIKKRHADKFGQRRTAPNAVASVDRTKGGRKSEPAYELDETEQQIMRALVRSGTMTEAEYIADLKKIKGDK
jgi:hypothetical protein